MINIRTVVLYVLLLALPAAMMAAPQYVPNVVLVQFQVGTEATALQNVASALDLADTARIGKTNIYRLRSHSQDAPAMVVALKARPDVLIVEPDYIGHLASTPNDTYWSDAGLWNLRQVAAQSAWDVTRGTTSFVVAVIDSGARYTHQDLSGNMWNNPEASEAAKPGRTVTTLSAALVTQWILITLHWATAREWRVSLGQWEITPLDWSASTGQRPLWRSRS